MNTPGSKGFKNSIETQCGVQFEPTINAPGSKGFQYSDVTQCGDHFGSAGMTHLQGLIPNHVMVVNGQKGFGSTLPRASTPYLVRLGKSVCLAQYPLPR
jgi:hypothetical protein